MKAIVCKKYGPPEVLKIKDVPKPIPKKNEILVKVKATTVTVGDVRVRSFTWDPWFRIPALFYYGFKGPRRNIPGNEMAGIVAQVGEDITSFKKCDQVYGITWDFRYGGTTAEYVCMRENEISAKPSNLTFEGAASIPIGALTALFLLKRGNVKRGDQVLIYGSSGSVGTYAVQLAKYFGAKVTAVCSGGNSELVLSLGAEEVIDYTKEDFRKNGKFYDIVFDAVLKTSYSECRKLLKSGGRFLTVDWPLVRVLWNKITGKHRVIMGSSTDIRDLDYLRELLEAEKIKPEIDRTYPIDEIVEAHRYVDKGHKKGNVAITI